MTFLLCLAGLALVGSLRALLDGLALKIVSAKKENER